MKCAILYLYKKYPINRDLKTTFTTFLLILILCCCYRKWRLHKKPELSGVSAGDTPPPGVSILKPLCASGDPNLFTNLETFFTLEYPKVKFHFQYMFAISSGSTKDYLHTILYTFIQGLS